MYNPDNATASQIRYNIKPTSHPLGGARNIGIGLFINQSNQTLWNKFGISGQGQQGVSPSYRVFRRYVSGQDRTNDAEAKLLESFANKFSGQTNIIGTLYLYTELPPCISCQNIFIEFSWNFPNIVLDITYGNNQVWGRIQNGRYL